MRLSEIRTRLRAIADLATDDVTAEIRAESDTLRGELDTVEAQHRAAMASEPEPATGGDGGESRERVALRSRARFGRYLAAAATGQPVDGAEAEYRDACGVPAGMVPVDLFEADRPAAAEQRAITPAPSTAPQQTARPTVPFLFERSVAARLGIVFPMVEPGAANFPSLTTATPAAAVAKDGSAPNTAGAFTLATRTPKRIAGQFETRVEDLAVFPSLETDLRMALSGALTNTLDAQVIAGDGTDPNLTGLFSVATDKSAEGSKATFETGSALFLSLVDGHYSYGPADLRAIIGSATYGVLSGLFQTAGDLSLFDYLQSKLGVLAVSNRVPAVASDAQKALVVRAGSGDPITVPTWAGMELIVDPYTGAGAGKRTITATMLVGDPFVPHGTNQVIELHPKLA